MTLCAGSVVKPLSARGNVHRSSFAFREEKKKNTTRRFLTQCQVVYASVATALPKLEKLLNKSGRNAKDTTPFLLINLTE